MMGGHRITDRVAELEKQLEEMKKYIVIGMGGSTIEIKSGGTLKLTGTTSIELDGGVSIELKGGIIKLNGGDKPVARVGDLVQVPGGAPGPIIGGSATVLVGG